MTHLTDAIFATVANGLPDDFESHDFIQSVMTTYPQEYVRELFDNVNTVDPIRTTHSVIGRTLHLVPGIVAANRMNSRNVRGPVTENQGWCKINLTTATGGCTSDPAD